MKAGVGGRCRGGRCGAGHGRRGRTRGGTGGLRVPDRTGWDRREMEGKGWDREGTGWDGERTEQDWKGPDRILQSVSVIRAP